MERLSVLCYYVLFCAVLWVQFDRLQFGGSEGGTASLQLRADGEFSDSFAASIFVYNLQGIVHKAEPSEYVCVL